MASVIDWEARALERHCVHCRRESEGTVYPGRDYLRRLQVLRGDEALRMARRVEPFFWSDADMIHVRLCDECAAVLGIARARVTASAPARRLLSARRKSGLYRR